MSEFSVVVGDMRTALSVMAAESFDACVTDPPYELGFMGKKWDGSGVAFDPEAWRAVYRVLKPGARLLAFGGSRTHHRIWCAIEDAGFVIEDTIMWLYGSGFPKHKSKLKPAYEPVVVARKGPVSVLNIDAARIEATTTDLAIQRARTGGAMGADPGNAVYGRGWKRQPAGNDLGRWPANIVLDDEAGRLLDEMSGTLTSGFMAAGTRRNVMDSVALGKMNGNAASRDTFADSGGASRFFYVAKADRAERDHGLEGVPKSEAQKLNPSGIGKARSEAGTVKPLANNHPCVKPVDLMRWLVRLVSQPGDLILDPFTGSGTTGVACIQEGRNFCGIELSPEYAEIARKRIGAAPLSLFGAA